MTRLGSCCGLSGCRFENRKRSIVADAKHKPWTRGKRYEESDVHGSQVSEIPASTGDVGCEQERPGQDDAASAGQDSHPISLPTVRPASSHLPQVWRLPHLF